MIRISESDIEFMLLHLDLPDALRNLLEKLRSAPDTEISEAVADELRDICTDKLDTHGYDVNYEPTELGKRLEGLIDTLYIG